MANTRAAYGDLLRRYLLPTFGPVPLTEIDVLAVRAWPAALERDEVGASTGQGVPAAVTHPRHGDGQRLSGPRSVPGARGRV